MSQTKYDMLSSEDLIEKTAIKTFDICCKRFGWNSANRGQFGTQKPLYAKNVTLEGYSVWCICNSNWTCTKGGIWNNKISTDLKTIEEKWDNTYSDEFRNDKANRVVFAKQKNKGYIFLGVYMVKQIDEIRKIKTYSQVSNIYN